MAKNPNGSGSISYDKRRKRYRARLTVQTPDGPKRKALSYVKTWQAAHDELVAALSQYGRRTVVLDAEKVTVAEYMRDWLATTARVNTNAESHDRYRRDIEVRILPAVGSLKLADLRGVHVRTARQEMIDAGYAPSTIVATMTTFSAALKQAVADELISRNPADGVPRPTTREQAMRILSANDAARLVESVAGTEYEAFYALALKVGARSGELRALRWTDLDWQARTLSIRRAVAGPHRRFGPTKTGSERTVKLSPDLMGRLKRHRVLQDTARLAATRWEDLGLIFCNHLPRTSGRSVPGGGVLPHNSVRNRFLRHLDAVGIERVRFHDLRHTAASLMLQGGVDIRTAADILGHANPAMTLSRYAHVMGGMRDRAAEVMASYPF